MTNERDAHFVGFAKLLQQELNAAYHIKVMQLQSGMTIDGGAWEREVQQLIARRAYDLARHIIWETMGGTPNAITIILADVPDLTEWPDTSPQPPQ